MVTLSGFNRIFSFLSPRKVASRLQEEQLSEYNDEVLDDSSLDLSSLSEFGGDTLPVDIGASKKRRATGTKTSTRNQKRRKTASDKNFFEENENDEFEGTTLLASTPIAKRRWPFRSHSDADRALMPPPRISRTNKSASPSRISVTNDDLSERSSVTSSIEVKRGTDNLGKYNGEGPRNHGGANALPENSGVWAQAERDLFKHLSQRGHEPLLQTNWMVDFRTLPLSLYANENSAPLIQANLEREFRAIRALRDLISMGGRVRDRALAHKGNRLEPVIQWRVLGYISWALSDAGMHKRQRPRVIPTHILSHMKRGQTTQAAIADLTEALHNLARRWRQEHDIRDSIEARDLTPVSNEETQVAEHEVLPVLYGLLICSSIVMVVTLTSHATPPAALAELPNLSPQSAPRGRQGALEAAADPEDSGLRFIARFDFSKKTEDVWNALAVAIVVMCLRNTMKEQHEKAVQTNRAGRGTIWEQTTENRRHREGSTSEDH